MTKSVTEAPSKIQYCDGIFNVRIPSLLNIPFSIWEQGCYSRIQRTVRSECLNFVFSPRISQRCKIFLNTKTDMFFFCFVSVHENTKCNWHSRWIGNILDFLPFCLSSSFIQNSNIPQIAFYVSKIPCWNRLMSKIPFLPVLVFFSIFLSGFGLTTLNQPAKWKYA